MRKQEIKQLLDCGVQPLLRRDLRSRSEVFVCEGLEQQHGDTVVIGRMLYTEAGRFERYDSITRSMIPVEIPPSIGEHRPAFTMPRDFKGVHYRDGRLMTEQEWRDESLARLHREFEEQRPSGWSRTDLNLALEDSGRPALSDSALRDLPNSVVALLCELLVTERAR